MKTDLFFNRLGFNPDLTTRQSRVDSVSIASRYRVLATLLLCLTLFVGSGNVWGADEVYKTATFSSSSFSASVSSYAGSFTSTTSGFTVAIANANNNNKGWNYIKIGGSASAYTGTITTSTAIDKAITKVELTIDAIAYPSNVTSIKLYSSSSSSSDWTEVGTFTKATGAQSVTVSSPTASKYYKIEVVCTKASKNGCIQLSGVKYYKAQETPAYTITASSNNNSWGTVSVSGTTITASPEDCYQVKSGDGGYSLVNGTATISHSGTSNTISVTPTSNCSIQVIFEKQPVNTYVDEIQGYEDMEECGTHDAPSLDDKAVASSGTCAQQHWHFMGWVTSANKANPTDENIITPGTEMTADGTTYYAVWAKGSSGGGFDGTHGGTFKIYADVSGTKYYATSTIASGKFGRTTNASDAAEFTIEPITGGFSIKLGSDFVYYVSSTNLGKQNSSYTWTFASGTKGTWRANSATSGRGFIYRDGTGFGGYSTSNVTAGGTEYYDLEIGGGYEYSDYITECVSTYTVSFAVNTAGYGSVSPSAQLTGVSSGTAITKGTGDNVNKVTVGSTTVTATPTTQNAQYTYAFSSWSVTDNLASVTKDVTITANFTRTTRSYGVTTNFTNIAVKSGSTAFPATLEYGGAFSTTLAASSGYVLPASVTVTGATLNSWNSSTGAISISSVTGAVTITAAGVPACTAPDHVNITGRWDRFGGETISLTATPYDGSDQEITTGITGYQWQKYYNSTWNNIAGATSATYTKLNCDKDDSGSYRCQVSTGATCTTASDGFQVKVYVLECYTGGTTIYNFTRIGDTQAGTCQITLAAGNHPFKFHADNDYYGNNGTINEDVSNWVCSTSQGNLTIAAGLGGTFTINMEYSTGGNSSIPGEPEISVTYPRKTIYFTPGVWNSGDAKFAFYYFRDGGSNGWTGFITANDCGSSADIPQWNGIKVIAVRLNSDATVGTWDKKWNQTSNITVTSNNSISITGWGPQDGDSPYDYGTYSVPTYTISYAKGSTTYTGGNTIGGSRSNETKDCGVSFTLPNSAIFTTTGYTQTGWATSDGGSKAYDLGGSYTTNATQAFYPFWTVNSYNLTWDLGGGTTTSAGTGIASGVSANTTTSVAYGTSLTAPTVTREGYTFSSWSPSVASTMPAAATTYTAQWTPIYTITKTLTNVSNTGLPSSFTYTGVPTTALNSTFTVNTTDFLLPSSITVTMGGSPLAAGTDYTYNNSTGAFTFSAVITGNIVITATATAKLKSIAITTQPTKRTYFADETFSSTGAVVTATMGDGSTKAVTASATWTPAGALSAGTSQTVTASYTEAGITKTATTTINVYSVTVNKVDAGGTAIADAGVTATWTVGSKTLKASAGSTKYVFKNWEFSGSNNGLSISSTTSASTTVTGTPTGNVTINAVFYNPVTITWSNNGVTSTTTTAYNTKPTFPSEPSSCDGTSTTFIGWTQTTWSGKQSQSYVDGLTTDATKVYTDASAMPNVTADVTYHAVFAKAIGTPSDEWQLVTATSQLNEGDKVVFAYNNTGTVWLLGYQKITGTKPDLSDRYYSRAYASNTEVITSSKITLTSSEIATTTDDTSKPYVLIVGKSGSYWTFYDGVYGGYLYAAGVDNSSDIEHHNKNLLYYQGVLTDAGKWNLSIAGATGAAAFTSQTTSGTDRKLLKRNGTTSTGVFSSYKSTSSDVADPYIFRNLSTLAYSDYLTTCCEYKVALSNGSLSHCTMSIGTANLETCSETASDRQVTITVTPDAGYEMTSEARLTFTKSSGTATATYVSGPTGSGPYTFVYQFNQNDNGAGTFDATCTPKTYTISLNDQTPTTAASPSSITATYDSNTGLTGTVVTTLPTKTGYTFGGYYTATGGGGVQIITDAGVVVANAGTGSYTDASKNWKYADDLTIYAKWTEKALTNYRTTCGVEITVSGSVWLTSYANVAVYTTNSPNNLITVTCTDFGSATRLGVKYIHNGDAVAKTSSPFRLCYYGFPGKTDYNKADGDGTAGGYDYINLSSDAKTAIASGQTFAIEYTPAADEYDQEDTYTIRLAALDGSTDKGYVDFTVHGRALPEQFVIASKVGDQWYALPNTILDNKRAIEPIEITVDNTTTPTRATNAPNTTAYQGTDRYASGTNRYGIRLADPSGHWLQVSSSSGTNYVWVSGTGSSTCQDWNLSSTDFGAYTLTVPSSGAGDKKMGIKSGNMGYYASPDDPSQQIYLLPADFYTEAEAQILKWKANSVIVMYTGTQTTATTQVGSNSASSAQTLASQKLTHGIYELTTAQSLASNDGKTLLLGFGDTKKAFDIPLIINSDVTATSGHDKQDVVIVNGGKLTAAATKYSFRNVYVYGGGKLAIPSGTSLGTNDIILRAGGISTNGSGGSATYEYVYPQFSLIGTLTNSSGKFRYEYVTDYDHWYQLCLPFNATLSSITYPQEYYGDNVTAANTGSWVIKRYAGEVRATGSYDAWKDIEEDSPAKTEVTAGQGYIFWGAPKKVTINGDKQRQAWGIQRMTMTIAAGAATTAETNDKNISVDSYSDVEGKSTKPNDQGWNLVGNPYMVNLTDWSSESMIAGQLVPTETVPWDGKWRNNGDGIRYVTIPDNHFDSYVAKTASVAAGAGDFMPGRAFFVQIAEGATTLTFAATNRASLMPALRAKTEVSIDVETGIVMSDESKQDEMNFWIKDGKTAEYEVNADYPKTMNGTNFNIYGVHSHGDLSWIAISPEIAEGSMPIGYQVPKDGEYMLSLSETYVSDKIEHMFVTDHAMNPEVTVDLMDGSYEFTVNQAETNNERFTISIKLKEDNPDILTGVESLDLDIERPIKFIYQDKLYILRGGVIYDATGKRVREVNK